MRGQQTQACSHRHHLSPLTGGGSGRCSLQGGDETVREVLLSQLTGLYGRPLPYVGDLESLPEITNRWSHHCEYFRSQLAEGFGVTSSRVRSGFRQNQAQGRCDHEEWRSHQRGSEETGKRRLVHRHGLLLRVDGRGLAASGKRAEYGRIPGYFP